MADEGLILDPIPSMLIESMRDIGYSFETALADIIDNSIAAGARNVLIETRTTPELVLAIADDGVGLSKTQLVESMRMGSADPGHIREATDLGRFGLGMKTASLSQCRKLTVLSKKDGEVSGYSWDLDHVVESNKWELLEIEPKKAQPWIKFIPKDNGTIVLWEKIDRIASPNADKNDIERTFIRQVKEAKEHLSLVFHRFLVNEPGHQKISIRLNGGEIEPIDPFNSKHDATIIGPEDPVSEGVVVQSYTLPHQTKYKSKSEYERFGLRGGYLKNQGIYLYRARRLIIYGTWFNLAKKTALTQLCRVKVDIDNRHDEEWKIDVKKVSAQLPEEIRSRVRNFINTFNAPSKKVYRRRGARQVADNLYPVWNSIIDNGRVMYLINRQHPLVATLENELDKDDLKKFETMLKVIESAFPTEALFYEISKNPEGIETPPLEDGDIKDISNQIFAVLKAEGCDDEEVLAKMKSMSIFVDRWTEVKKALGIEEE